MFSLFRRLLVLVWLLMLVVIPGLAQEESPQPMTILMTFVPNIQFAPMYAAIASGYFAEAGQDVNLEYLNEPDVVDIIAAGQQSFGVVSGEQVILAAAQDRPIVYVYEWFDKYPIGIVYSADRDITSASDLIGLRVGIPGRFGAAYSGFTTLLTHSDVSESEINLLEIGFNAPDVFCVGALDAAVVYVNNEPLQIRNRAAQGECEGITDVNVLLVSDIADLVSNGIITSRELIENDPEQVREVVAAYDRGLRLTINNPARAYLLSADFVEGLPLEAEFQAVLEDLAQAQDEWLAEVRTREEIQQSREQMLGVISEQFDSDEIIQFEILLASIELWDQDQPGYSALESWENMQETLMALGYLSDPVSLDDIFSNDFLPQGD